MSDYAISSYIHVFVWTLISLVVEFLGHMVTLCLNCQAVFHRCYRRVPVSLHPFQSLLVSIFLMIAILMGENWYLTVLLIYIFLMTNDLVYLFMYFLPIYMSLVEKMSIQMYFPFSNSVTLFFCYWVIRVLYISWIQVSYQICDLPLFSPILWLSFNFLNTIICSIKFLILVWSSLSIFFFHCLCFWCSM